MKSGPQERELRQRLVGRFLKQSREKVGMTQQELARRLSYSTAQFISNWERGVSLPPLDLLPKIAVNLSIPPRQLIEVLHRYQEEILKLQKRYLVDIFRKKFPEVL